MTTTALASSTELAARLNTTFDAGQTAQAEALLAEASALIRATVRQTLTKVAGDIITRTAPYGRWLDLPQRPVRAVTAVKIGDQSVSDWKRVGDRLWRAGGWLARDLHYGFGGWWPWPPQDPSTVTVTYDHGYDDGDDGLQLANSACIVIAAQAVANPDGVKSESIDDYRVTFRDDIGPLMMPERLEQSLRRVYARDAFEIDTAVAL